MTVPWQAPDLGRRSPDDNLFEYDGLCRTKATLVRNWTVPVCSRLGSHPFSAWPKHGASPLLSRRPGPPERLHRTIAGTEESVGLGPNDAKLRVPGREDLLRKAHAKGIRTCRNQGVTR